MIVFLPTDRDGGSGNDSEIFVVSLAGESTSLPPGALYLPGWLAGCSDPVAHLEEHFREADR